MQVPVCRTVGAGSGMRSNCTARTVHATGEGAIFSKCSGVFLAVQWIDRIFSLKKSLGTKFLFK